ncbi:peptidase, partial [Escherichia coli]
MNLFDRLLHRRLCNEQPADGGAAPASSEQAAPAAEAPAPAGDPAKPEGDKPHPGTEGDKPQDDKPANGDKPADKSEDEEQKQEGAPEKYEFTAGEGVELDTEALKDFEPVARDLNLTNEQAQKLVDAYPKILAGVQQRQAEAWQKQTEGWAET